MNKLIIRKKVQVSMDFIIEEQRASSSVLDVRKSILKNNNIGESK